MKTISVLFLANFIALSYTLPQLKSSYRNYQTDRSRGNVRDSPAERRRYETKEEPKCRIDYDIIYDIEREEKFEQKCETKYRCVTIV